MLIASVSSSLSGLPRSSDPWSPRMRARRNWSFWTNNPWRDWERILLRREMKREEFGWEWGWIKDTWTTRSVWLWPACLSSFLPTNGTEFVQEMETSPKSGKNTRILAIARLPVEGFCQNFGRLSGSWMVKIIPSFIGIGQCMWKWQLKYCSIFPPFWMVT